MEQPVSNELNKMFEEILPGFFDAEAAKGMDEVIHFAISDATGFTYTIAGGALKIDKEMTGKPTCVVKTDAATALGVFKGTINPMQAVMSGKMKVSDIGTMGKFSKVFNPKRAQSKPVEKSSPVKTQEQAAEAVGDLDALFLETLPMAFDPQTAGDWEAHVQVKLSSGQQYTLSCAGGAFNVEKGLHGTPTCIIRTDPVTANDFFSGRSAGTRVFMNGTLCHTNFLDMNILRKLFNRERMSGFHK